MLTRLAHYRKRFWQETSPSDKIQTFGLIGAIVSLLLVFYQLRESTNTNKVSIRGQLYQTEGTISSEEAEEATSDLNSIWAFPPKNAEKQAFASAMLGLVSKDSIAANALTAEGLYRSIWDVSAFSDEGRRKETKSLRKLFLFIQSNFYHVHNAFDYRQDNVLNPEEWKTWKGLLREMHGHPMLLAVIYQGHRNRYYSSKFAEFIQKELCSEVVPADVADREEYVQAREFIRYYYKEMFDKTWPDALPKY